MLKYIEQLIEDGELTTTNDAWQAIAMLDDGTLIGGEFCDGIRGIDHNALMPTLEGSEQLVREVTLIVPETGVYISDKVIEYLEGEGLQQMPLNESKYVEGEG